MECSTELTLTLTEQERGFLFTLCFCQIRVANLELAITDPDYSPAVHDLVERNHALLECILRKLSDARYSPSVDKAGSALPQTR